MEIKCWLCNKGKDEKRRSLVEGLKRNGIQPEPPCEGSDPPFGICFFDMADADLIQFIHDNSRCGRSRLIAIVDTEGSRMNGGSWSLLQAGASDVLAWTDPDELARQVKARFERWLAIDEVIESPLVSASMVGKSPTWQGILRELVEVAKFSESPVLILGESGTGKELIARLVHLLDPGAKRDFVILDCSTIVPELSGSEFFGHERGSFTGAVSERDGGFALAHGGALFLDEVGELPLPLQAQLLRVVQEKTYKRVGGNTWHKTEFRLVCATNRDLLELVKRGEFRADLYYRIASSVCRLPPLRDRVEDILPLAEFFLSQYFPNGEPPQFDDAVREYLLRRDYPGNVRELRQVISRLLHHYPGSGVITVGNIPPADRPCAGLEPQVWRDLEFEKIIQRAVLFGVGLKDIGRAAEEAAIRIATEQESGNIQRAARRLGVTDRALQIRRSNRRQQDRP
jgi:transcriptional regulator with GAF, ATPase, and Fis domain